MAVLRTFEDMQSAVERLVNLDMSKPWDFDLREHKRDRSADQNRLAFQWYGDVARHFRDRTVEEVRAQMKLEIGVPIMRQNERFRETYDRLLKPLPYAEKLELIERMDLPITRLMTVPQMQEYLDQVERYWRQKGVALTQPE